MRKRRDRSIPCVVLNREKRSQKISECLKKNSAAFGMANYLPEMPASEDEASLEKHRTLILKEYSKSSPNHRIIDASMDLSFYDRRKRIIKDSQSIMAIKEAYPCLFDCHQVSTTISFMTFFPE